MHVNVAHFTVAKFHCIYTQHRTTHSTDGIVTTSTLAYNPNPSHNGSKLQCIAENPRLFNTSISDSMLLNIYCKRKLLRPKLNLSLANDTNNISFVVNGSRAVLDCHVEANPAITEIHWLFNSKLILNSSQGNTCKHLFSPSLKSEKTHLKKVRVK
ncbi:hemicentin-2-like protein [Leptotrombidium deliense]|uniref:Hemicentin-2-like protein n=1 Tax=Leptotrombidium deliense TaxID=299467 RepID=A0A443SVK9_9ACAR|nr:hemicentin-2-like protein [Leptotrombidium deliense]